MSEVLWRKESTWNNELRREKLSLCVKRNTSIPDYHATKPVSCHNHIVDMRIEEGLREMRHVLETFNPRFNENFEIRSLSKLHQLHYANSVEEKQLGCPEESKDSAQVLTDGEKKLFPFAWVARRPAPRRGRYAAPILMPLDYVYGHPGLKTVVDFQNSFSKISAKSFIENCSQALEELERKGSHVVGYFMICLKEPLLLGGSGQVGKRWVGDRLETASGMNPKAPAFTPR